MSRIIELNKITVLELEGIGFKGTVANVDALITLASWDDGTPLAEDELDFINNNCRDFVQDALISRAK